MINPVPQNIGYYPAYPMVPTPQVSAEAQQFRQKTNDEISVKQAYVRVEFLQNTLEKYNNELTQEQKNVLTADLLDAQRTFAMLKQQLNAKYGAQKA